jgi:hypothetical protein
MFRVRAAAPPDYGTFSAPDDRLEKTDLRMMKIRVQFLSEQQSPPANRPDFFIVGAPRCGTSAMVHYLGEHPDVYMARKEMHVFGSDLRFGSSFYRRGPKAYLEEFTPRNGQRRAGEAYVWYLYSARAAAEIKAFNPEASIIIMLREPVTMLYSLYYQFLFGGNEHLPTFEEALAAENERRAGRKFARQAYFVQGLFYRAVVRYTEQIRRYFDTFGRERVHVVIYDDFAADPESVYHDTLDFLGLGHAKQRTGFKVMNGNVTVKNATVEAVLNDPWLRSTALALRSWMPRPVFGALQQIESRIRSSNVRVEKRPPLPPEVCARLKQEFAPDVETLSELLGRDLTSWSR